MKQKDLLKHLRQHGCHLHRRGGRHDIWINPNTVAIAPVPRHNEIKKGVAYQICTQLSVPKPD